MYTIGNIDYMLQEIERWGYNARRKDMPKTDSIIAKDRYMRSLSETANMLLNIGVPAEEIVKAAPLNRESVGKLLAKTA